MTRSDALPEAIEWKDTGCPDGLIPACLTCPLRECRYMVAGGGRALRNVERRKMVSALIASGLSARQAAEQVGVSRRTVMRDRKRLKHA